MGVAIARSGVGWFCSVWLVFACIALGFTATGTETLSLDPLGGPVPIAPHTRHLIDPDGTISLSEAINAHRAGRFAPVTSRVIDPGISTDWHWLRVPLANGADEDGAFVVAFNRTTFYGIDLFLLREGEADAPPLISLRHDDAFEARGNRDTQLAVPFTLAAGENAVLYMHLNAGTMDLPVTIESAATYENRRERRELLLFLMLGATAGVALATLFSATALGGSTAIAYAAYLLVAIVSSAWFEGYFFKFLWPGAAAWDQQVLDFLPLLALAFGLWFNRSFLQQSGRPQGWFDTLIAAAALVNLALFAFYLASVVFDLFSENPLSPVAEFVVVASSLLPAASGLVAWWRGQTGALPYLAGCAAITLSTLVVLASLGGASIATAEGFLAYRSAILIEAICFALAIHAAYRRMRRERTDALEKEITLGRERLALSEALRVSQAERENAVLLAEQRRETMASAAHDIAQPLASLRLAMLRANTDDAGRAGQISEAFDYLDGIVQQNLSGSAEPTEPEEIDDVPEDDGSEVFEAGLLLASVKAMFAEEAAAKGLVLAVEPSAAQVIAAPVVLMRILSNLTANAIRNTEEGSVELTCERAGDRVVFHVADTGTGMDQAQFDRLSQPGARAADYAGSGLGLATIRSLAAEQGYGIAVERRSPRGTRITVSVPAAPEGG